MSKFSKLVEMDINESAFDLEKGIKDMNSLLKYLDPCHKRVREKISVFQKDPSKEEELKDLKKIQSYLEVAIKSLQNAINSLQDSESMIIPSWKIF